jgi:hypothetical protein
MQPAESRNTTLAVQISLGIMAVAMLLLSRDFSMSGDEASQMQIGRNTYVYLCRAFGFLPGPTEGIKLDNYSGLFGVITTNLAHWMPWWEEVHLRHFVVAITGFFAIFYAGKTSRLLWGRTAELLTIWMLICSPRFFGASMNNSKDIPFALGMMMVGYFLLCIVQSAPRLERRHLIGLFFGVFIAVGVRIGGLVFCGFYAAVAFGWLATKHWRAARPFVLKAALWMGVTGLAAFLAAIIFLPKVWTNIPLNTARALQKFSNYYVGFTQLYQGRDIPTTNPPWHYLPVWVGITVPVVVIGLFAVVLVLITRYPRFSTIFLLLMVVFPPLITVAKGAPVYDSWRQFYFIYPPMVVLAGGAGAWLWERIERPAAQLACSLLFFALLAPPVLWSIRNHPLEHVYFNETVGGVDGAYGRFETDYYGDGIELACRKLLQQPAFAAPIADSIYVANNIPTQVIYYLKKANPRIAIRHIGYEKRDTARWDYGIFATRGVDSFLKRGIWPPAGMVDSVVADRTLLFAIVKRR